MIKGPLILIIPFIVTVILVFLFAYVIGQKRRNLVNRTFLYFTGILLIITIIEFFFRLNISHEINLMLTRFGLILLVYIGFLYMNFMFAVTSTPPNRFYKAIRLIVVIAMFVSLLPGTFSIAYSDKFSGVPKAEFSPYFAAIMGLVILIPSFYGGLLCLKGYFNSAIDRERQILKLLIMGIIPSISIGVFIFVVVPFVLPGYTDIYLFSSAGSLVHFVYMFAAVGKHNFLSIDIDEIQQVSKSLFANSMDAVVVFDTSGNVVQANEQSKIIFGQKVIRSEIQRLIPDYSFSEVYDKWRTNLVSNNKERQILVSQSIISTKDHQFGKLLLIREITDVVQMERYLQESEKLKAIGLLAGGVAHDFNNQLMCIMGNADLLKIQLADNQILQKNVNDILTASRRSADLTSQLLAFARKGNSLMVSVDIHSIIQEVVELVKHSMDKRIEIVMDLQATSSIIMGDASQLQNAILNLALNARDALDHGGMIKFSTKIVERKYLSKLLSEGENLVEYYVNLSVEDTGIGMDNEIRQRVFEPFFTTKDSGLGTGMGLAVVHGTVENHKGIIEVDSISGRGTTVHLYFPINLEMKQDITTKASELTHDFAGRVLVVDDEPLVRKVSCKMLEALGYSVELCEDGKEALELYQKKYDEIDLVILDLVMTKMSGLEVLREIRKINPKVKVLIASGYNKSEEMKEGQSIKECGILQKPFDKDQLSKAIASL